ncbi:MAG: AraC family transcriptional regulator [Saprospiraceae bacterium]|nr:AraC family transcriptional regulator [Saprospiraceae bacterium]
MDINLLDLVILVSLAQGFVFGLGILLSKAFRATPARLLAYSIMMIATIGLNIWLSRWGFDERYYFIDFFGDDVPWMLLYYVPLFLFFLESIQHPYRWSRRRLWLFLPFVLFLMLNIFINGDVDFEWYAVAEIERIMEVVYAAEFFGALAYSLLLCSLSYWLVWRGEDKNGKGVWLKKIWWISTGLILLWLLIVLLPSGIFGGDQSMDYIFWGAISGFIYWTAYKGLYQFKLPQTSPLPASPSPEPRPFTVENSHFIRLEKLMKKEELYRDPTLGRDVLAERLGISSGYLSQLINAVTGENITHYINNYRVEAVKKMIQDPDFSQYSLLALGEEAGFSSKSAFYTTFKKKVGMTPNAFRKQ